VALLLQTAVSAGSSRTKINKPIAEPSMAQAKASVASSGAVIYRQGAEQRLAAAAANADSSRILTAKRPVEQVSEVVQVAQAAAIILNVASSWTLMLVLTAGQPMATVVVSAVSSGTATFRPCVELKQGVEQHSVVLSKIGICKLRAGQRRGADLG
jgi:hypothetical protein